jgi:hypothetical protein
MAMTLRQFLDGPARWKMFEKGLQGLWNQFNQILASESGSGITAGTTVLSTADIADGAGAGIQKSTLRTISGPFALTGGEKTVTGMKVQPADPGGAVGPHPARISNQTPSSGFRPSI